MNVLYIVILIVIIAGVAYYILVLRKKWNFDVSALNKS
jgi:hypothetical protein